MFQKVVDRRKLLGMSTVAIAGLSSAGRSDAGVAPELIVYRNPGCGCCGKWAASLQADGFLVKLIDDPDLNARRAKAGVPADLAGCHTAIMGDYVVEGHVPSEDIARFLKELPKARGLAVAGMPMGSPGMETSGPKDSYDVILFAADGTRRVYASH